jgi:hypothetical protein
MESWTAKRLCASVCISLVVPLLLHTAEAGSGWPGRAGLLTETAHMQMARANHTATLLPNGKVLIAGGFGGSGTESNPFRSTELYDPKKGSFETAADMTIGRSGHTATLLKNGKVLIVGGWTGHYNNRRAAELYDPATGLFRATGEMVFERASSAATLLADGRVLVTGGDDRKENAIASAEIYDPTTEKFTPTGNMNDPRGQHTATALTNGKVLIVGGASGHYPSQTVYRSAELYDPATGKFSYTGEMTVPRHKHAAILLPSGRVLVVGGSDNRDWHGEYSSAEIYDPASRTFQTTGSMATERFKIPAALALLENGKVLVAGGGGFAEVYDETKGTFMRAEGSLGAPKFFASATLLPDGEALITGGYADSGGGLPSTSGAWIYKP